MRLNLQTLDFYVAGQAFTNDEQICRGARHFIHVPLYVPTIAEPVAALAL